MSPDFTDLLYSVDERVATITLNRPEHLNAGTVMMVQELVQALDLADSDDGVRAIILTGAGKAFCAGADLSGGTSTFDYGADVPVGEPLPTEAVERDGAGLVTMRMFDLRKPVIAAVNGVAVGMGATIPLAADIRLAAETARFGFVFARRGIVPEGASTWFLPRLVGMGQAAEWLYTGRLFDAAEALRGGLVNRVVAEGSLAEEARLLAHEIATSAPLSVALTRQMLWRMQAAADPMAAHVADSRAVQFTGAHRDTVEGIRSFFEKRPPVFTGSVERELPDVFPGWRRPLFR